MGVLYLKSKLDEYVSSQSGSIGTLFATSLVVIVLSAGFAIDYSGASGLRNQLQNASDSAALAAAIAKGTEEARTARAVKSFDENTPPDLNATTKSIDVIFSAADKVTVTATANFNTVFLGIVNRPSIVVSVESIASTYVSGENVRCVHALDRYEEDTLILNSKPRSSDNFSGASLFANSCETQVDSLSTSAVTLKAGSYSSGKNCFVGSSGTLIHGVSPKPETTCKAVGDPFLNFALSVPGACDFIEAEISGSGHDNKATVEPGTYCGGLNVEGDKVEFKPGVYRITDGPLEVKSDSFIRVKKTSGSSDDGVTFVVTGEEASVQIEAEEIDLKARKTGPAPSFIFYIKDANADPDKPEDSNIKVKQFMRFEGIIYAPGQHVQMRWSRPEDEYSPYWNETPSPFTSVVARSIDFHGYSQWGFEFKPELTDLDIPKELSSKRYSPRLIH